MSFRFLRADFLGDPNLGLYGWATGAYCLLGHEPHGKLKAKFTETLQVPMHHARIAGSDLVGLFATGNSSGIIVSKLVEKHELAALKEAFPDLNIAVIESDVTAIGNLVLCNDSGALVSGHLEKFKQQISETLGVPVETGTMAGFQVVGSACAANSRGALCHKDATDEEMDFIEGLLKVKADLGTVAGSPFIKAGLLVNANGSVVGTGTTGAELGRVSEVLGEEDGQ